MTVGQSLNIINEHGRATGRWHLSIFFDLFIKCSCLFFKLGVASFEVVLECILDRARDEIRGWSAPTESPSQHHLRAWVLQFACPPPGCDVVINHSPTKLEPKIPITTAVICPGMNGNCNLYKEQRQKRTCNPHIFSKRIVHWRRIKKKKVTNKRYKE